MHNHVEVLELLLQYGAVLEAEDEQKCTALHLACKKGRLHSVQLLLMSEANIYAQDFRQWTGLHYASYNGHKSVCNLLLKWEADRDILRDMVNTQAKKAIIIVANPKTKLGFSRNFIL